MLNRGIFDDPAPKPIAPSYGISARKRTYVPNTLYTILVNSFKSPENDQIPRHGLNSKTVSCTAWNSQIYRSQSSIRWLYWSLCVNTLGADFRAPLSTIAIYFETPGQISVDFFLILTIIKWFWRLFSKKCGTDFRKNRRLLDSELRSNRKPVLLLRCEFISNTTQIIVILGSQRAEHIAVVDHWIAAKLLTCDNSEKCKLFSNTSIYPVKW